MFLGFVIDAWITIITVLGMFSILLFTKWRSDIVFLGAIGVLYVTGVLDVKEAFSGFSGTSVVTVGVLFVVVAGLMQVSAVPVPCHLPCHHLSKPVLFVVAVGGWMMLTLAAYHANAAFGQATTKTI